MAEPALSNLHEVESGVVVDLFLSLRDVKSYTGMIELFNRMPPPLQRARIMREQYAFALNREEPLAGGGGGAQGGAAGVRSVERDQRAARPRLQGPLGAAKKEGRSVEARGLLRNAIDTYLAGFQADWRDAYPGINAVTLMEMQDKPDPRQAEILPVVRYAALQKAKRSVDYWDHATLMELAVIGHDEFDAERQLSEALGVARASWELESTAGNLAKLRKARAARGEDTATIERLEQELLEAAKEDCAAEIRVIAGDLYYLGAGGVLVGAVAARRLRAR